MSNVEKLDGYASMLSKAGHSFDIPAQESCFGNPSGPPLAISLGSEEGDNERTRLVEREPSYGFCHRSHWRCPAVPRGEKPQTFLRARVLHPWFSVYFLKKTLRPVEATSRSQGSLEHLQILRHRLCETTSSDSILDLEVSTSRKNMQIIDCPLKI